MDSPSLAAFLPFVLLAAGFVAYCLFDLARAPSVRHMPKWAWAIVCVVSVPVGGILYLTLGRGDA